MGRRGSTLAGNNVLREYLNTTVNIGNEEKMLLRMWFRNKKKFFHACKKMVDYASKFAAYMFQLYLDLLASIDYMRPKMFAKFIMPVSIPWLIGKHQTDIADRIIMECKSSFGYPFSGLIYFCCSTFFPTLLIVVIIHDSPLLFLYLIIMNIFLLLLILLINTAEYFIARNLNALIIELRSSEQLSYCVVSHIHQRQAILLSTMANHALESTICGFYSVNEIFSDVSPWYITKKSQDYSIRTLIESFSVLLTELEHTLNESMHSSNQIAHTDDSLTEKQIVFCTPNSRSGYKDEDSQLSLKNIRTRIRAVFGNVAEKTVTSILQCALNTFKPFTPDTNRNNMSIPGLHMWRLARVICRTKDALQHYQTCLCALMTNAEGGDTLVYPMTSSRHLRPLHNKPPRQIGATCSPDDSGAEKGRDGGHLDTKDRSGVPRYIALASQHVKVIRSEQEQWLNTLWLVEQTLDNALIFALSAPESVDAASFTHGGAAHDESEPGLTNQTEAHKRKCSDTVLVTKGGQKVEEGASPVSREISRCIRSLVRLLQCPVDAEAGEGQDRGQSCDPPNEAFCPIYCSSTSITPSLSLMKTRTLVSNLKYILRRLEEPLHAPEKWRDSGDGQSQGEGVEQGGEDGGQRNVGNVAHPVNAPVVPEEYSEGPRGPETDPTGDGGRGAEDPYNLRSLEDLLVQVYSATVTAPDVGSRREAVDEGASDRAEEERRRALSSSLVTELQCALRSNVARRTRREVASRATDHKEDLHDAHDPWEGGVYADQPAEGGKQEGSSADKSIDIDADNRLKQGSDRVLETCVGLGRCPAPALFSRELRGALTSRSGMNRTENREESYE